ncbi:acyl carrier protein [Streptococcus pneumoniae]|nr:acyl carrier protein [Streptococcus pneumoniae]
MTEKEIFDRIVTIIQERQGEDFVVTESLSLKDDLDADSVDLMEFILTLEDEFSIEISDEEIDQLQSVGDVVEVQKLDFFCLTFGVQFTCMLLLAILYF